MLGSEPAVPAVERHDFACLVELIPPRGHERDERLLDPLPNHERRLRMTRTRRRPARRNCRRL